jgi:3'-phosphoadenosine 5'-phosphosulfate sulfotransferase (PAPS reductase)/FAD synthetase
VIPWPDYVLFASYGNDSIALIQWAHENGLSNVFTLYSDTGWAKPEWYERVERAEEWVRSLGFTPHRTTSIGLEALVREKKAWPRQGMQFCTTRLKMEPSMRWLDEVDPLGLAVCMVGVRREESQNRRNFPERFATSENHGGRSMWAPLVDVAQAERDRLIQRAGFDPLPHRSDECFPCVNSNRNDLRRLAERPERIDEIAKVEGSLGFTSKGKPRTMFRPYRHMGASGIREIVRWAMSDRGSFDPDDGTGGGNCDSGFCGV